MEPDNTITISTDASDCITLDIGDISLNTMSDSTYVVTNIDDSYTIDISDVFTSDTIDISNLTSFNKIVFEDYMPDPQKLKKMCDHYPALKKVYENFKTVYSMVEQDWRGNHDDQDDLPF